MSKKIFFNLDVAYLNNLFYNTDVNILTKINKDIFMDFKKLFMLILSVLFFSPSYSAAMENNEIKLYGECVICPPEFKLIRQTGNYLVAACGCRFHPECYLGWCQLCFDKADCPVCKHPCPVCKQPCHACEKPCPEYGKPCPACQQPCHACGQLCPVCKQPCHECKKLCTAYGKPCPACKQPCHACVKLCPVCKQPCHAREKLCTAYGKPCTACKQPCHACGKLCPACGEFCPECKQPLRIIEAYRNGEKVKTPRSLKDIESLIPRWYE